MKSSTHIPKSSYGILCQDHFDSEVDVKIDEVRRLGFTVLDSGFTPNEMASILDEFERVVALYRRSYGEDYLREIDEFNSIRALLIHSKQTFMKICFNEKLISILDLLMVGKYILNQQNGIINPPLAEKYNQGSWHRDLPYQHFVSTRPLAINALFCLDDFTKENGGTFVLPGSHRDEAFPSQLFINKHALQIEARAGQFLIMDSMLFHSGGVNLSNFPRRAINQLFTIPFFKQQISFSALLDSNKLSKKEAELLGFGNSEIDSIPKFFDTRSRKLP